MRPVNVWMNQHRLKYCMIFNPLTNAFHLYILQFYVTKTSSWLIIYILHILKKKSTNQSCALFNYSSNIHVCDKNLYLTVQLEEITAQPRSGCAHLCFKTKWAYPTQSLNPKLEVIFSDKSIYFGLDQLLILLAPKWAITCQVWPSSSKVMAQKPQ
jgi:hypothetical protein